jgi:anaerobic selenocysteine-containing dehydrogenase/Fe-S-cluster-containing dehydrogenase component
MSDGLKRRDFLKVLGAGSAGAATVGCTTGEVERLIPYVIPSDDIVPGVPTWYTSTCRECPAGCGILVETHEGRVTKVEGNPDHPISHGNLCARGQASVQGLYHPDRFTNPMVREGGVGDTSVTWGTAERLLAQRIREIGQAGGAGRIVLLTQQYTGTMDRLATSFAAATGARRVTYDPWANQPRGLDFASAGVLVSFGADFLETWGSPVDYAWQFAQMRRHRQGQRGKFVWVGPHRPLTGLNADQWLAPLPGTEHVLALALGGGVDAASAAQQTGLPAAEVEQLVSEFQQGNGVAIGPGAAITGGDTSQLRAALAGLGGGAPSSVGTGQEVLQLIEQMRAGQVEMILIDAPNPAYTMPASLGFADALRQVRDRVSFSSFPDDTAALGTMVLPDHHFLEGWGDYSPQPGVTGIVQPAMRPVFNTKQVGDVFLAVARELGTDVGGGAATYYDYLRMGWAGVSGGGEGWRDAVRRGGSFAATGGAGGALPVLGAAGALGGAAASPAAGATVQADTAALAGAAAAAPTQPAAAPAVAPATQPPTAPAGDGELSLVVYPSYRFYDGRTANRPWLLELPDPVTKVPWGSWVELHPHTAAELGIEQGDVVEVTSPFGSLETYAYVYPGLRPDVVAIQAGLGHDAFGRWTEGVGVNPNVLLGPTVDAGGGGLASYGVRVSVNRLGGAPANLPWQAGPGLFEQGVRVQYDREIAQAVSLAELARLEGEPHEEAAEEVTKALRGSGGFVPVPVEDDPAAYPPPGTRYGEYVEGAARWAMVVDISACIGCSACVIACQAENNIPVVGPKEMKRGRELHWLRIERYFGVGKDTEEALGEGATDDVRFLPMLCQHCGNAPCEPVCPVYAAYHTPDGLNGQVYNRCVGTRYCANNCPYKVRVFNWWTYEFQEPLNWQLNPDVTVRDKGVMEKCTFCVQRIREAENHAARENRSVADGEIVPACVQTCPTEVFTFGNIQDPNSRVAQAANTQRSYRVLDVLNTQPAIVYLKKVTLHEPAQGGHHAAETAGAAGAEAH